MEDVRTMLGRFLFSGDDVYKLIGVLSGGERSRLALAKMLLRPSNVLLLDEPTNHLDVAARETLESALADYPGTLVLASHDRYLMDKLANKVVEIEGNGRPPALYVGNYTNYREKKAAQESGDGGGPAIDTGTGRGSCPPLRTREGAAAFERRGRQAPGLATAGRPGRHREAGACS